MINLLKCNSFTILALLICSFAFSNESILLNVDQCDIKIIGALEKDGLGIFFAFTGVGDFNGDGKNDIVISSGQGLNLGNGCVDIFEGGQELPKTIDLSQTKSNLTITGLWEKTHFGMGWWVTDLDDDGFDDLLIVNPASYLKTNGAIYIFRGKPNFFTRTNISASSADIIIEGSSLDYEIGWAVAVGDINNDGKKDIISGNDNAKKPGKEQGSAGRVQILFGKETWPAKIELNQDTVDVEIYGEGIASVPSISRLGRTVEVGDLNNDGLDDLIAFDLSTGQNMEGKGYIFYGRTSWPKIIDLQTTNADVAIQHGVNNGALGHSLAVADVDGDGVKDLLFSANPGSSKGRTHNGIGYILLGKSNLPSTIEILTDPELITIHGRSDRVGLGYLMKAGDFNGDGLNDVLLTGTHPQIPDGGYSIILKGRTAWPKEIDLDQNVYDWYFKSGEGNLHLGSGAYFMNINNDSSNDLVIGDPRCTYQGREMCGVIYIFFGPTQSAVPFWNY
jgi:VCBS repeat protein/FG-GAP repeat protein